MKSRKIRGTPVQGIQAMLNQKKHILQVYCRVLSRSPNVTITDDATFGSGFGTDRLKVVASGNTFHLSCSVGKWISVTCEAAEHDKIFYEYRCPKDKLPKLRKQALILAKKISLFDVYKVMET
jgi:hypothetical protein